MSHEPTQPDTTSHGGPKWARPARIVAAIVVAAAVAAAAGYWLVVPGMASKLVRDKLDSVETRLDLDIETDAITTDGLSGVRVTGLTISDAQTDGVVAKLGTMSATIDTSALLSGERQLSSITVDDAQLRVRRRADGTTNLGRILARRHTSKADQPASAGADTSDQSSLDRRVRAMLRLFDDQWPDAAVHRASVNFEAAPGARPWTADSVVIDTLAVDSHGTTADLAATVRVERGPAHPRWQVPGEVTVEAALALPLEKSTGHISFDKRLEIVGQPPYPFVRVGLGSAGIDDDHNLVAGQLSVGVQGGAAPTRLATIERVSVSFDTLATSLAKLRPLTVHIVKPVVTLDYDAQFGSGLNDLVQLARAPLARHIHGRARSIADAIARQQGIDVHNDDTGGLLSRLKDINWSEFLYRRAPQTIRVDGARVEITDHRRLALEHSDEHLALEDGHFKFSHGALQGQLSFESSFRAVANGGDPRGKAEVELAWNYRDQGLSFDANIDALSVPWVVQMTDADLADHLRSGLVRVDVDGRRDGDASRLDVHGLVSAENATIFASAVAEEPIKGLSASYDFEAHYDPDEVVAKPALLAKRAIGADPADADPKAANTDDGANKTGPDKAGTTTAAPKKASDDPDEPRPPRRGAAAVTKGHFEVNGIPGEFRPALYGLDGVSKRPARFDVAVKLPKVDVDTLFKAVPDALKGPLTGTAMTGTFGWTLDAEIPLYRADDMKWDSRPTLQNFELVDMPEAVDVRNMRDAFDVTIYDPTIEWKRQVHIPRMRPVPIQWLTRHSGLSAKTFRERRKERQWPPRYAEDADPDPDGDGIPNRLMAHRSPWAPGLPAAPGAADGRARGLPGSMGSPPAPPAFEPLDPPEPSQRRPSGPANSPTPRPPGASIPDDIAVTVKGERQEHPYGRYTYVPLQYISPWVLRAAMTTEDNSFFEHHGFNWFAIKDSVEDNLEAGRFVRGASTISMQLVKNVFLTRKKVLARKFREAFLVWLMEDVVDIPKARILELYFNVIEYGPGIFGINDAAVHYFGKRPDQLGLTEVAWLVSIVPNPKKYHVYYERGHISDAWFRHMLRYVKVMQNRGRVTDIEYERAEDDKPAFYIPADGQPMMRVDRDAQSVDEANEDAQSIDIPGLDALFSP